MSHRSYKPLQSWTKRERRINENGYVLIYVPEHPRAFCGGWYYEHRLFMEREYGRLLKRWETVHHINCRKTENTWENLFLCSRQEHDYAA